MSEVTFKKIVIHARRYFYIKCGILSFPEIFIAMTIKRVCAIYGIDCSVVKRYSISENAAYIYRLGVHDGLHTYDVTFDIEELDNELNYEPSYLDKIIIDRFLPDVKDQFVEGFINNVNQEICCS
ncbi:unknown similar to AMEV023 [Adoxophyes honmai entomopoxvirus 'L']|uniref:Uncharacterized protein n=1 Tax=Adoxophyes honmai entomopoxvirus 'L' TaxID=1293540 RepID=A0A916P6D1_9POXV|nr:unknown similar to AMEV023 [Adoxophyes honmai entomopoxvirus 'L']CCU55560.1 unknown similar to AMEV023 [Adoxophyes honmai entomopoxvirus 'L']